MRKALALLLLAAAPVLVFAGNAPTNGVTAQMFASLFKGCWVCGTFNTVSAIGLTFADKVFSQLADSLKILIGLFMALWVLFFAAKLFLPFGSPGASHWNEGAAKFFKLLLVLGFLQSSGPFWNYVFVPLMSAGMGIASQMINDSDEYETDLGGTSEPMPGDTVNYCSGSPPLPAVPGLSGPTAEAVTAMEQMDCPLSHMQSQFAKGILIGVALLQQGSCGKSSLLPSLQDLSYLVAGVILVAAFLAGLIVFPLLLVDVLMRVILVAAISPISIAATLFKPTAHFAERGLWTIVQCSLTMVFGSAVCGLGKGTMAYVYSLIKSSTDSPLNDWQTLQNAIENSCSLGLDFGFLSANFYILLATAVMMIFMMRRAPSMAAELTHSARNHTGAQEAVAAMAGRAAAIIGAGVPSRISERSRAGDVAGNASGTPASNARNRANEVAGNR